MWNLCWEGLGLDRLNSGIGSYGREVQLRLKSLGLEPFVLGPRSKNPFLQSKLGHILWSQFQYLNQRSPTLLHGLANVNVLPIVSKNCRQVLTVHDLIPLMPNSGSSRFSRWQFRWLLGLAVSKADKILVPSLLTQRTLCHEFPAVSSKVVLLPYGPPPYTTDRVKKENNLITMVSRWEPYKGFDTLAAVALLRPGWRFCVVTDERGVNWCEEKQLNNIEVYSGLSSSRLKSLYMQSKAVFHPSHYEGFGLPALEGLSVGTPVVFRKNTPASDFMPSFLPCGFESEQEAVEQLETVLSSDYGDEIREWYVSEVPTWDHYTDDLVRIYRDTMEL